MRAVLPPDESERLAAVRGYAFFDSDLDSKINRLTRVASVVFSVPMCTVTLLDLEFAVLRSCRGLDFTQAHRDVTISSHAILQDETLVVCDAAVDPRFADNPFVIGSPFVRFYVGAPLRSPGGLKLGTLCVMDSSPRPHPRAEQLEVLEDLAAQVVELLEAEKAARQMLGLRSDLEGMRKEVFASQQGWRRTEQAAAVALDAGRMGFWEFDARAQRIRWSERMFSVMGYATTEDAPRFEQWLPRVHPDDQEMLLQNREKFNRSRDSVTIRLRLVDPDGKVRHVTMVGNSYFDDDGERLGSLGVCWDSTVEYQKEQALAESEELFRGLSSSCPIGIFRTDSSGLLVFANRRLQEIFERSEQELLGSNWARFIHSDDAPRVQELWEQSVIAGEDYDHECRFVLPGGGLRWLSFRSAMLYNKHGQCTGHVGSIDDITDRKRTLEELLAAKESAEAANRSKSLFLSNVSHEIRTPLNGVMGMAELLLMTELSEEQQEMAKLISDSGYALLKVVDDILDIRRIEAGHLLITEAAFNLKAMLGQALRLMQPVASQKGLALESRCSIAMPETFVGDADRIRQILVIFIDNALKFTLSGAVEVEVEGEPISPNICQLLFLVHDTGPGIAEEDQPKLFVPFSQLDASITRKHGGVGLGLAIARRLAELMGGSVGVTSTAGNGSTFWFRVTLTSEGDAEQASQLEASSVEARQ